MRLDEAHWTYEKHTQRIITKDWRIILLAHDDKIIAKGRLRQLKIKSLGAGVVEVYKEPLAEKL